MTTLDPVSGDIRTTTPFCYVYVVPILTLSPPFNELIIFLNIRLLKFSLLFPPRDGFQNLSYLQITNRETA